MQMFVWMKSQRLVEAEISKRRILQNPDISVFIMVNCIRISVFTQIPVLHLYLMKFIKNQKKRYQEI